MKCCGCVLIFSLLQPRKGTWSRVFQDYRTAIISIATLAVVVIFLWHLVSDGDFSFLMVSGFIKKIH